MSRPKVAFTGYYGMSNYGDDLFALLAVLASKKIWPGYQPFSVSPKIKGISENCTFPSSIPEQLFERHGRLGTLIRATTYLASVYRVSHIVHAGGSVFRSGNKNSKDIVEGWLKNKMHLHAIGVSIGPFQSAADERSVVEKLKRYKYVAVRDQISYDRINSFGLDVSIHNGADIAGLAPLVFAESRSPIKSNRISLGFTPCNIHGSPERSESYCKAFVSAAMTLSRMHALEITVLCLNEHGLIGDRLLAENVHKALLAGGLKSRFVSYKDVGIENTWTMISGFDVYLSARLHGAVSAYFSQTPFFLFEYQEKCSAFLTDVGVDAELRLCDGVINSEKLVEVINKLLEQKPTLKAPQVMTQRIVDSFTLCPLSGQ